MKCTTSRLPEQTIIILTQAIHERHRHGCEVNNDYREVLKANGMSLSDFLRTPDEIPSHP